MKRAAGFSLIELMVTLLIIAILTTIAFPIYLREVREAHRTSARSAVLDLASREERYYSTHNRYTATASDLGYTSAFPVSVPNTSDAYYALSLSVSSDSSSYTATATPLGNQTADPCGTYTVDQLGQQGNSVGGSPLGGAASADCWR
jgi:prepilin-type N-terminal cleavage/methylation domain